MARLCRTLDGIPLGIELSAARVRALSVEQIADRLRDRFQLLDSGDRTAPLRQQTLRATVDWSYELLDEQEQILLRRLAVFSGWNLDMAEQVCSDEAIPADAVLGLLISLIDKSLVVLDGEAAGDARYRLLDTIREYAAERLAAAGERSALSLRHRDCILALVEETAGRCSAAASRPGRCAGRCSAAASPSTATSASRWPRAWRTIDAERGPAAVHRAAQHVGAARRRARGGHLARPVPRAPVRRGAAAGARPGAGGAAPRWPSTCRTTTRCCAARRRAWS